MKRILAILLCAILLIGTMTIVASAEVPDAVEVETEADKPTTEIVVDYIKSHVEELAVIISLVMAAFYKIYDHRKLNGSIGTLNNNAITVAEKSATTIKQAFDEVANIAKVVDGYKEEFATIIGDIRKSAEEKKCLEDTLAHVETFLKSAKLATLELSNEVAELLVLANIPNSKKEELYARHTKAVHEIEVVEEVMSNDGSEA